MSVDICRVPLHTGGHRQQLAPKIHDLRHALARQIQHRFQRGVLLPHIAKLLGDKARRFRLAGAGRAIGIRHDVDRAVAEGFHAHAQLDRHRQKRVGAVRIGGCVHLGGQNIHMCHALAGVVKPLKIQNLTERKFMGRLFGRPRRRVRNIQGHELHAAFDDRLIRQLLTLGDKRGAGDPHRHLNRRFAAAEIHHLAHGEHLFRAARRRRKRNIFALFTHTVADDVRQHRFFPAGRLLYPQCQRTVHADAAGTCRPTVDIVHPCRHKGLCVGGGLSGDAAGKRLGAGKRAHAFALLVEIQHTDRALPVDEQLIPAPLAG